MADAGSQRIVERREARSGCVGTADAFIYTLAAAVLDVDLLDALAVR